MVNGIQSVATDNMVTPAKGRGTVPGASRAVNLSGA
jgi:hypothetical protein